MNGRNVFVCLLSPRVGHTNDSILSHVHEFKGFVWFDGFSSDAFDIRSSDKQGCVLAPTLFGIFFVVTLKHALELSTDGVNLSTRSDGKLFSMSRLKAKTNIREALIRDMLFADDAAVVSHSEEQL